MSARKVTGCRECAYCVGCVDRVLQSECGATPLESELLEELSLEGDDPYDAYLEANPDKRRRVISLIGQHYIFRF